MFVRKTVLGFAAIAASIATVAVAFPAVSSAGPSYPPTTLPGQTVPSAPRDFVATPGNGEVIVRWTAPASNGNSPLTGYVVTSTPPGGSCTTAALVCTIHGLTNGTSYTFNVVAKNVIGSSTAATAGAKPQSTIIFVYPFAYLQSTLTSGLQSQVAGILHAVQASNYSHVTVNGYTNPGTNTSRQNALGLARATKVANYLKSLLASAHISGVHITVASQGGTNLYGPVGTANRLVVAQIS